MSRLKGGFGEDVAAAFLVRLGYRILVRNFVVKGGELDIVAKDADGCLVFCEVKYYVAGSMVNPLESITPSKQRLLSRAAELYLKRLGNPDIQCRFDAIVVRDHQEPIHLKNIF
jgi:putative endonuclease